MVVHVLAVIALVASVGSSVMPSEGPRDGSARMLQAPGDPIAIISELPENVSNGQWYTLNASLSTDPDGTIRDYEWEITHAGETEVLTGYSEVYKFRALGLYKIQLTVTDDDGNTGVNFTAVYSVPDIDSDLLPDDWEDDFFDDLSQSGTDDFDGDGYTNLQEFASGTDPTVKDAQPGLIHDLEENWEYLAAAAAVVAVLVLALYPRHRRKLKQDEKKKIEAAIEIEKALEVEK
ncbi:MAG: hypothetical protein A3K67_03915 [Euryarchaeota archaeon RBG_16_62_10]|nr:MAG: hypothetical protein A3K67_03915 [Euryarchaeota archaeon RBG_16_62_10]